MCAALSPDFNSAGSVAENITTAVVFLEEVSEKGYEKGVLRTYLVNKCGLSSSEVAKALEIHAQRAKNKKINFPSPKGEKIIARENKTVNVNHLEKKHSEGSKRKKYTSENVLSFLKPEKQIEGLKVIKEFLKTEWKYCNTLTCLEDYCKELTKLAGQRKIQMSIKEVEDIFVRVPSLLHFHRMFYTELTGGYSIGQLFIKCFNFFKAYIEFMKSCTSTINKMRQYARDQRLHNYLAQIRQRSKCELEDMFDLLLYPLDRVSDYKVFLDKLCKLADEGQQVDYEYLSKAARRIGRISNYIEKYKYWIFNRSEMNRVQRFLDHQWDILAPHRRIIRRGIMVRRSMGWSQRNKRFIFFLFNDLFLWTSEKGELQNVVYLWNCKVYAADSKSNTSRTFKLAFMGKKHGTLLLECSGTRQKQEWYNAIKKAISGANDRIAQAWSKADLQYSKDDEPSGEAIIVEPEEKQDGDVVLPMPPSSLPVQRIGREKEVSSRGHDIFTSDATYDEHYENAHNFRIQEFKEFEPMEDAVSISGSEQRFHHGSKSPSTTEPMSAFKIKPKATRVSSEEKKYASGAFSYGAYDEFSDARSQCSIRRRSSLGDSFSDGKKISPGRKPQRQRLDSFGDDIKDVVKERRQSISSSPSLQVFAERRNTAIRRSDETTQDQDLPLETLLKRTSSFTMRLNDLKTLRLTDVSEK